MAVVPYFMSDRDKSKQYFTTKKEAEELDRKLEIAAHLGELFLSKVEFLDEIKAEELGMIISEHAGEITSAFKGKFEGLQSAIKGEPSQPSTEEDKVTSITGTA